MNYKMAAGGCAILAVTGLIAGAHCTPERSANSAPIPVVELRSSQGTAGNQTSDSIAVAVVGADSGSSSGGSTTGGATNPDAGTSTPTDPVAEGIKYHDQLIAKFNAEGLDPSWSRSATQSLQSDFQALSSSAGFRIVSVGCHMTMCVARLEYPNFDAAEKQVGRLVGYPYALNCVRGVYTIPPGDPAALYQGDVVLDCEHFRTDGP